MKKKTIKTDPRDRILEVASELFFHQGFRATGLNEVISKSGVAKATFYNHFPAKVLGVESRAVLGFVLHWF